MPRRARITLPDVPLHVIQRGNNRQACFQGEDDYRFYLDCLEASAAETGCAVHAYVLMTNHVHLLLTPASTDSAGRLMKRLGQRYVQHINRTYERSGTLWEGRFRSCIVQADAYLLACYRYIELNPVRARMVSHPGDYPPADNPGSSYPMNGRGAAEALVTPQRLYPALGDRAETRQAAYRKQFRDMLWAELIADLGHATNGNIARFQAQAAARLGRRVTPGKPGRPRLVEAPASGDLFEAGSD